jgi:hypothetical protein
MSLFSQPWISGKSKLMIHIGWPDSAHADLNPVLGVNASGCSRKVSSCFIETFSAWTIRFFGFVWSGGWIFEVIGLVNGLLKKNLIVIQFIPGSNPTNHNTAGVVHSMQVQEFFTNQKKILLFLKWALGRFVPKLSSPVGPILVQWTMFWQDYISIFLKTKDHYYW